MHERNIVVCAVRGWLDVRKLWWSGGTLQCGTAIRLRPLIHLNQKPKTRSTNLANLLATTFQ